MRLEEIIKNMEKGPEKEILKLIQKANLSPKEAQRVLKNFQQVKPQKYHNLKLVFPKEHVRFLAFTDMHMGHRNYRPDITKKMIADAKRQGCKFGVNAGDTIEGIIEKGLERELHEELNVDCKYDYKPVGYLNDDTNDVGTVHFGMVYKLTPYDESAVTVSEKDMMVGKFMKISEVDDIYSLLETWSQITFSALKKGQF